MMQTVIIFVQFENNKNKTQFAHSIPLGKYGQRKM